MAKILEVYGLHKEFRLHILNNKRIVALANVDFTMEEGEIIGLTGKSGAGKSTLMKCLYRTYLPTSGQIRMHTTERGIVDLAAADEHTVLKVRRSDMTYCSQFLQAIPRVPALDVAVEELVRRGCGQQEAHKLAREAFRRLSLPEELWDAYPSTFSGGERQRVNIIRAILARPRFLLVDEPTASLDLKTKDAVIDMLVELRKAGASIILISHDPHSLGRVADRCLQLDSGRLQQTAQV